MMRQVQQVVLLADSSKFGQQALVKLCALGDVHIVVTDPSIEQKYRHQIEASGARLIVAE